QHEVGGEEIVLVVELAVVDEAQNLRARAQIETVPAEGQLDDHARDRPRDEVVELVARLKQEVALVLEPLGEERGELEPGQVQLRPHRVHVDGAGRPGGEAEGRGKDRDRRPPPNACVEPPAPSYPEVTTWEPVRY